MARPWMFGSSRTQRWHLRSPQFSGGVGPISSHVQLAGEAIHVAASGGHLEILKDLLATWWHDQMGYQDSMVGGLKHFVSIYWEE